MANPALTPPFGQSAILPSGVLVTFPIQYCDGTPIPANNPPVYTQTVSLTGLSGFSNLIGSTGDKIIHDTCPALMATAGSTTPNNLSHLTSLAQQIATDFYAWNATGFNYVFNGVNLWDTAAFADEIVIHYERDQVRTMVSTVPWTGYPEEFQHTDNPSCSTPSSSGSASQSASGSTSAASVSASSQSAQGSALSVQASAQSQSQSVKPSQSQLPCPLANNTFSVVSEVECIGGRLAVFKTNYQFVNGDLTCVNGPYYDYDAGCCDCPTSASASSSGSASAGSQSSGGSQSLGSQSACPCPCVGVNSAKCFHVDISPLYTGPCLLHFPVTGHVTVSSYDICKWGGYDYDTATNTYVSYTCDGWQMTVGNIGMQCYWVLKASSAFDCCTGASFIVVSGPTGLGLTLELLNGPWDPSNPACPPNTNCFAQWK